jgi:ParB family chromosome partitioning protein
MSPPGPEDAKPVKGLGRGLSALLGDGPSDSPGADRNRGLRELPVEALRPGRFQPRRHFDAEAIEQLAQSIREKGIIEPLIVRRMPDDANAYEIVAGERRWRAAQRAQLHQVPAVVKDLTDAAALEIALIENVQRQDLGPLEECDGYQRLIDDFDYTQEQVAQIVGKSRSHIANTLRLSLLPEEVKKLIDSGDLTAGHARAIMALHNPVPAADIIVRKRLNVRQAEKLAKRMAEGAFGEPKAKGAKGKAKAKAKSADAARAKDPDTMALERDLTAAIGLEVAIVQGDEPTRGELRIVYTTLDQLDDLCRRLAMTVTPGR